MVLRKESEIVVEAKDREAKPENIESEAPDTTEEEATESVDVVDSTPARKKESIRKKSIPLLDEEHRMSAVIEASDGEVAKVGNHTETTIEVPPPSQPEADPSKPSSIASPAAPPSDPSLQLDCRKVSNMSSSSDWSWPSVQGQDKPREGGTAAGAGGLSLVLPEGPSRRISTLAPAEVDSPLATKVDKFTMIPHPGK